MTPTLGTRPVSSVGLATNWRLSTVDNQTHPDSSFDRQRFLYGRLSICFSSCICHSCIFHSCYLLLVFPLLHIPPVRSTPASSTPAISTPAVFSCSFHSCIFHSCIFSAPDDLTVTCGLTACACTPGSAPGPTLGNEYNYGTPFYCAIQYDTIRYDYDMI